MTCQTSPSPPSPASIAMHLPPELVLSLGQFLTGPSLLACLQLNKSWYQTLLPLVWSSILKAQWHHPAFPIQQLTKNFKGHDLPASLSLVHHLEWHCNVALKAPLYLSYFSSSSSSADEPPWPRIATRSQLSGQVLTRILESTPNLTTLSLTIKQTGPRVEFFDTIRQLQHLRRLSMDVAMPSTGGPILLNTFYPLFAQLDELSIAGTWYHYTSPTLPLIPSPYAMTTATSASAQEQPPWRIRKLRTSIETTNMIQRCPRLVSLALQPVQTFDGPFSTRPFSLRLVLMCPNLQELKIAWFPRNVVEDLVETLSSLPHLRTLEYCVLRLEHFQFLVPLLPHQQRLQPQSPPISQEQEQEEEVVVDDEEDEVRYNELPLLAIPALEHITIKSVYINSNEQQEFDRLILDFLKTRPLLKTFALNFYPINPRTFFPQPGKEPDDKWACTGQLEKLDIRLPSSMQGDSEEQIRREVWRPMYRQLGELKRLKSLTIKGKNVDKSLDAGISYLAGAVELERVGVKDVQSWVLEREGVMNLIRALGPKVKFLRLAQLLPGDLELVSGYLQEAGRSDIVLREN